MTVKAIGLRTMGETFNLSVVEPNTTDVNTTGEIVRTDEVLQLREQVASLESEIVDLEAILAERNETIADLRDRVEMLERTLSDRDGKISALEESVADLDAALAERDATIAAWQNATGLENPEEYEDDLLPRFGPIAALLAVLVGGLAMRVRRYSN